jgi:hypothetical protein
MSSPLDNLAKVSKGGLKLEPPNQAEFDVLVRSAKRKLLDAATPTLGLESAFDLAGRFRSAVPTYTKSHNLAKHSDRFSVAARLQ